ncbi:MAG: hypothetical protein AAFY26_13680 [Cyanobacteria bacterium J06638_22]
MQDKAMHQTHGESQHQQELGWVINGAQSSAAVRPIQLPQLVTPQKPIATSPPEVSSRFRYKPPARPKPRPKPAPAEAIAPPSNSSPASEPSKPSTKRVRIVRPKRSKGSGWKLSLLAMMGLGVSGGLGLLSLIWLTTLPPMPRCERVSALSPNTEQLYCVREVARSGQVADLKAAVELVQAWTPNHPLYAESQQGLTQWSRMLLEIARQRYQESDLKGALEVAGIVPESSSLYEEAQVAIAGWQDEWQQGEDIYNKAQEALADQAWHIASEQLRALGQLKAPYWREHRMAMLTNQIFAERSAWGALQEARRLARTKNAENLVAALTQLDTIDPQTHAWDAAKAERQEWSTALAEIALQRWQGGQTEEAIALAQLIPTSDTLDAEGQNLVRYSHAQQLAQNSQAEQWEPAPAHLWQLREAIAALEGIPQDSLFYASAQERLTGWQTQLADAQHLQLANAIASLGQRPALELAIHQAAQVDSERPRRQQAQTLIAHWTQQIERLQDMPLLTLARQQAEGGSIADLRTAIALALRIEANGILHSNAQDDIGAWSDEIERIEDQPILNQAQQYAEDGNLQRAIQEARAIEQGRSLYAEARQQIDTWQATIDRARIAEDREILDEATALASQDSLTRAIDLAAQIGSDRPLYGEARSAIAQWEAEREMIWEMWEAQEAAPSYEDPGYYDPDYNDPGYSDSDDDDSGYNDSGYDDSDYYDSGYSDSGYAPEPNYYDEPVY